MDMGFDLQPVYPHHDLLIELGSVEMAMDGLDDRAESERGSLKPQLESRMHSLRNALSQLEA